MIIFSHNYEVGTLERTPTNIYLFFGFTKDHCWLDVSLNAKLFY